MLAGMSTEVTPTEQPALSATVAGEIRALMGRREINKTEMARRLAVSDMWIGRRLKGRQDFTLDDLQRIAAVLGVGVSDLLPKVNVCRTSTPLGERVVATVGETRKARPHRPGRPVRQTRPIDRKTRPMTVVAAGR